MSNPGLSCFRWPLAFSGGSILPEPDAAHEIDTHNTTITICIVDSKSDLVLSGRTWFGSGLRILCAEVSICTINVRLINGRNQVSRFNQGRSKAVSVAQGQGVARKGCVRVQTYAAQPSGDGIFAGKPPQPPSITPARARDCPFVMCLFHSCFWSLGKESYI